MLSVCHLYPDLLNLYGDRGNVIAFLQRCRWRDIPVQLIELNAGESIDFNRVDFLFLGGGSDREQNLMAADLEKHKESLREAIEDGLVVLSICGGYQLLGQYYRTPRGEEIPGLGILDHYTVAGEKRLIGNVAIEMNLDGQSIKATGFENHGGQTYLGSVEPLGKVLAGYGNNGKDGTEGARYKNVFCSYLHGPLLPKNHQFTDYLIKLALQRRGIDKQLTPLDDSFEKSANNTMLNRLLK
ncbi:CobQ-like glutamine amidotransferase family enzyme [Desulfohalotomaculum tongense]|uniref:type 1 glutamine amidotransferase n=1 Tax=Desulforadius tongensis TaxID=1216062 RepID=UPI00195A4AFC|nr:glutamine amidotransferase [Desulforadius tongensis]MBM7854326.1 CobQ-like glutamine amidotransferase family enzyme [Desulforadius tongensis]